MEDLFKQFRTNWQNRPEPPFDEKDWAALQKDLDRQAQKRRLVVLPWWKFGVPVVLLLAASNLAFFMELKHTRKALNTIEKQRDTIWMTCVEYQTDTIFRERPAPEKTPYFWSSMLPGNPDYAGLQVLTPPLNPKQEVKKVTNAEPIAISTPVITSPGVPLSENEDQTPIGNNPFGADLSPLPLPGALSLAVGEPELPAISLLAPQVVRNKKSLRRTLHVLRPKSFVAGIEGGWSYPLQKGVQSQSGYSAGFTAALGFSPNIWLWANAGYSNIQFRAERMGEDLGIPIVLPPSDDFSFQEAEATLPALHYGIGLDYYFRTARRFKPLLGMGIGKIYRMPYEITYDFVKASEGIEWSIDKLVEPPQGAMPGFFLARAGFDHEILKRWHWQMMISYRASLNKPARYFPQIWGVQTGLLYHF